MVDILGTDITIPQPPAKNFGRARCNVSRIHSWTNCNNHNFGRPRRPQFNAELHPSSDWRLPKRPVHRKTEARWSRRPPRHCVPLPVRRSCGRLRQVLRSRRRKDLSRYDQLVSFISILLSPTSGSPRHSLKWCPVPKSQTPRHFNNLNI